MFCRKPLGANEVIESFPVGRRLAFDGGVHENSHGAVAPVGSRGSGLARRRLDCQQQRAERAARRDGSSRPPARPWSGCRVPYLEPQRVCESQIERDSSRPVNFRPGSRLHAFQRQPRKEINPV